MMKNKVPNTPIIPPKVKPMYMPKPRQSRKEWDKYLQSIKNFYQRKSHKAGKAVSDYVEMDEVFYRRRADAVLNLIDTVEERYRDLPLPNPLVIGEEWAALNMTYHLPQLIEDQFHLLFAAAIWILDNAEDEDEENGLFSFLPTDDTLLDDYFEPNIWHSQYTFELITSVEYVLDHRNDEDEKPEGHADRIGTLTDIASANGAYPESKARKAFEGLIALIPEKKIAEAVQAFETFYWRWTDAYFESKRPLLEKLIRQQEHYENLRVQQNEVVDQIADMVKELSEKKKNLRRGAKQKTPVYGPVMPVNKLPETTNLSFYNTPRITIDEEDALIESASAKYRKIEEYANAVDQAIDDMRNTVTELNELCSAFMADAARPELEWIYEEISDPFALCFAYLYLLDTGSDLPWLYGSMYGFLTRALENLPWGIREYDDEEDLIEDPELYDGKRADIPDWNLRRYRKKDDAHPRSLTQLLYEETGCLIPGDLHCYDSRLKELGKYGIRGKDAVTFLSVMAALRQSRDPQTAWNLERSNYVLPVEADTAPANENLIPQLKGEIDRLRGALHEADKAARQSRKELEEERKTSELERRELADLRELIFRQLLSEEEETEADIDDAVFPYTVQNDTLVFGGHDTWVKAIKPLFKGNVRFVDKNYVFDPVIIRRTEIIWIQTNAIAHKQFYRIVDAARLYKKTVRYFTYAGVKKCAIQIVENDGSGTKN